MPRWILRSFILFVSALLSGVRSEAQQQVFTEAPVYVTAIELVADVRDKNGAVPANLEPADFLILEDGVERPVIGVDYARGTSPVPVQLQPDAPSAAKEQPQRPEWQIVVYFDTFLSGPTTIRTAADALMNRAEELAKLGSVDVVVGEPKPTELLAESRDPRAIRRALKAAVAFPAKDALTKSRRDVRDEQDHAWRAGWLEAEILHERTSIRRFHTSLLQWLSRYPRRTPRALLLVSDGFDLDAADFYSRFEAPEGDALRLRAECDFGPDVEALSKSIAAAGWTTVGIHSNFGGANEWANDTTRSIVGTLDRSEGGTARWNPGNSARNPLREKPFISTRNDAPLRLIGEATGGWAGLTSNLPSALSSLEERVILTYQVARPPDGKMRPVEVRARRPDVNVRTFGWSADALPEDVAAARALGLLRKDGLAGGSMPVSLDVRWKTPAGSRRAGQLTIQSPLAALKPLLGNRQPVFRVTIVVIENKGGVFTIQRLVSDSAANAADFAYRAPIEAPAVSFDLAVTVEELSTGMWGGQKISNVN